MKITLSSDWDKFRKVLAQSPQLIKQETDVYLARARHVVVSTINRSPWSMSGAGGGVPVRSADLRRAHLEKTTPFSWEIYVSNAVDYGWYVHQGTRFMKARPWLDYAKDTNAKAIANYQDEMLKAVVSKLAD